MKNARQILWGIVIAVVSIAFILGGLSLSLVEGNLVGGRPTASTTPSLTASPTASWTGLGMLLSPNPPNPASPTTAKTTLPPTSTGCPPPPGWKPYTVQAGDTLEKLAERYKTTTAALLKANCLPAGGQFPLGTRIHVPPAATATPVPCGPPHGWVKYIVQRGDTLYRLSLTYGITVAELQKANCMGQSTLLTTGQTLYVPPGSSRTPLFPPTTVTDTPTAWPTVPTSLP